MFFTQMDDDRNVVNNRVFTTTDGTSGIGTNPIQPHTVRKEARSCTSCHDSNKALGLGGGIYDIKRNFPAGDAPVDFESERIVDENGKQLQQTARDGARPFNKEEMERIRRSGTCIACHGAEDSLWQKVKAKTGVVEAPNDAVHTQGIRKILEKAAR